MKSKFFISEKTPETLEQGKVSSIDLLSGKVFVYLRNGLISASSYLYDLDDLREGNSVLVGRVSNSYVIISKVPSLPREGRSFSYGRPIGPRALFGGGWSTNMENTIDYFTITIKGNATDFGNLTRNRSRLTACSSPVRGLFIGGVGSNQGNISSEYITFATKGNASPFTDMSIALVEYSSSCSSPICGIVFGGWAATHAAMMFYINIATEGERGFFGSLTGWRTASAACSSPTRGVVGGGTQAAIQSIMEFITIATTGNSTLFGDLSIGRGYLAACSYIRGVFGGGQSVINTIDYIIISTLGNAADFGDLSVGRDSLAACSSPTRGVFGGGQSSIIKNTIDYIIISTLGNAADFGDLSVGRAVLAACSNSHGGL